MAGAGLIGEMVLNAGYSYREKARQEGQNLLQHFLVHHRHSTEGDWRARIERGEVSVDGALGEVDTRLGKGQEITWRRPPWVEPDVDTFFQVLHEDAALLAVVKPRGLPTLPGGGFLVNTLLALVREQYPEAHPMHRLGRETSGIVLFSRTPEAGSALQAAWREQRVEKRYRALGSGVASEEHLEITAPIGPVPYPLLGTLHAASASGKPSRSHARVLERRLDSTLFQVDIDTGRPHQIRIHLAFAGHPLVGDPLYGSGGIPRTDLLGLVPKPPRAALGAPGGVPQGRRDEHSGSTRFERDAGERRPPPQPGGTTPGGRSAASAPLSYEQHGPAGSSLQSIPPDDVAAHGGFGTSPRALPGDGGYFLHAERLAFPHPATGDRLELRAEPPEELRMAGE